MARPSVGGPGPVPVQFQDRARIAVEVAGTRGAAKKAAKAAWKKVGITA